MFSTWPGVEWVTAWVWAWVGADDLWLSSSEAETNVLCVNWVLANCLFSKCFCDSSGVSCAASPLFEDSVSAKGDFVDWWCPSDESAI